jgi:hypothetical protein
MQNTTLAQLVERDPSLAALMGARGGADFGHEGFGYDFGDPNAGDGSGFHGSRPGDSLNYGGFGFEQFGFGFGQDMSAGAPMPPADVARQLYAKHLADTARTNSREVILNPNKGSSLKVERYGLYLSQALTLGTVAVISQSGAPDTLLKPQRVTVNVPMPGMVTLNNIRTANVSVIKGTADAFDLNPNLVGSSLDMALLSPANQVTVTGDYTGFTPPGYVGGTTFTLSIGFKGPATVAGGGATGL